MKEYKRIKVNGKVVPFHRYLYEKAVGKIPKGWLVHHLNGNIFDNRITNLVAVSKVTHERIHSPNYVLKNGKWLKKCITCGRLFDLSRFTFMHHPTSPPEGTPRSWCKRCECERVRQYRYERKRRCG
jgi:hypothetical protein